MKAYIKPELFYERYEVSQHLADCAWEFQNYDKPENCVATPDLGKLPIHPSLFLDEGLGCQFTEAKEYETYCYQNSEAGIKLHMS